MGVSNTDMKLFGGTVTGIGIMAAGAAFNVASMGMAGAGLATVAGLTLGAKMAKDKLFPGDDNPEGPEM